MLGDFLSRFSSFEVFLRTQTSPLHVYLFDSGEDSEKHVHPKMFDKNKAILIVGNENEKMCIQQLIYICNSHIRYFVFICVHNYGWLKLGGVCCLVNLGWLLGLETTITFVTFDFIENK
jgi:hypothetical protein